MPNDSFLPFYSRIIGDTNLDLDSILDMPDDEDMEFHDDDGYDDDYDDEPRPKRRRIGQRMPTKLNLPRWKYSEREQVMDHWPELEMRMQWIFDRVEREGFTRNQIQPFSVADLLVKLKRQPKHQLNNDSSQFYDWHIGGTDFILRLESYIENDEEQLRCHYVYSKNGMTVGYADRVWDGARFCVIGTHWAEYDHD